MNKKGVVTMFWFEMKFIRQKNINNILKKTSVEFKANGSLFLFRKMRRTKEMSL